MRIYKFTILKLEYIFKYLNQKYDAYKNNKTFLELLIVIEILRFLY
jgi:hypothetical protein